VRNKARSGPGPKKRGAADRLRGAGEDLLGVRRLREDLRVLERETGAPFEPDGACCGVTTAQCHTLLEIAARGPVSLAELAEALGVDASTMSRAVQGLVLIGLVAREASASDRRAVSITLTAQGRTVTKRIDRTFNTYLGAALAAVPADRRTAVLEGVGLLAAAVRALGKTARRENGE
jgi:DNA-binding MarR family transcriptional regulator